jgi:hypothetical protein
VDWKSLGEHIQLGDDQGLDEIFGGSTFDYSDELSQEIPAGSTLHVNDDRGTITINVGDGKAIKVSVRKKVRAEKEQDAESYNSKTKPQVTVGEVNISDHTGNVSLSLDGSSARLAHVKGDVTIQGKANEVAVEDVDGAVHLNGEFQESVRLVRVSKTVSFRSSRTEMEFARLDGRLDLDSGDLRADSLSGPMRLTTRSKDIALEGLSGDLRLQDENGTVEVGLHKPGNIQIDNRKGDVQVSIPPNTPIKIEARTHQGEIESDFEEIKVDNRNNQSSASGSIGTNGPRLVMNCEKGTIEIRKGTVAVVPPGPPIPPAAPAKSGKPAKALPAPRAKPVESEN